ncbi:type II toxin-antitoxin system HipA family toxin [uncultured Prevotella sp.]|mgnify:FL=1|uniref:type II toxin-antitoxin system HipA family toxin n=1 Tax=uncultured Prevotella sp. TaxID=159272 RepID=UPI0027E2E68F|nr:type II toxin-antitoxin system HipA family toxin [uncultured Prevotella sp.]
MERLLVYADFNWLNKPELVGELCYEKLRGSDSYAFKFDENWMSIHAGIKLSEDINNYPGMQYTQPGNDIFGCFSDALPDRWGRTLLKRREQIQASEEKRAVRSLSSFDYLMGIDDFSRMGGFRFKRELEGDYINVSPSLKIPPLTEIRELIHASQEVEKSEDNDVLPEKKWITQLIQPGTSLGGARPKAGVLDEMGNLCIAKFPSKKDDYDTGIWEHFSHLLAQKAGIQVAQTRVLDGLGKYHTLLSRRFDRTDEAKRIHFASSMSLLGLKDGDNAQSGFGYLDIVDFIIQGCCDVEKNLHELYRRVAFNICIGNSDDHFRNHGFLLTPKGWTLSPAYDMNPTLNEHQSLLINESSNKADIRVLLDSCESYMINKEEAEIIIHDVQAAVSKWENLAIQLQIPIRERNIFKDRFKLNL